MKTRITAAAQYTKLKAFLLLKCEKKAPEKQPDNKAPLIIAPALLKKDSKKEPKSSNKEYICSNSHFRGGYIMKDTVILQIEKKYIDQIAAGEKTEDYRTISAFNTKLLCDSITEAELKPGEPYISVNKSIFRPKTNLKVAFVNGYKTDAKINRRNQGIYIDKFIDKLPQAAWQQSNLLELGIVELKTFDYGRIRWSKGMAECMTWNERRR